VDRHRARAPAGAPQALNPPQATIVQQESSPMGAPD
jgi:hypothetical protein